MSPTGVEAPQERQQEAGGHHRPEPQGNMQTRPPAFGSLESPQPRDGAAGALAAPSSPPQGRRDQGDDQDAHEAHGQSRRPTAAAGSSARSTERHRPAPRLSEFPLEHEHQHLGPWGFDDPAAARERLQQQEAFLADWGEIWPGQGGAGPWPSDEGQGLADEHDAPAAHEPPQRRATAAGGAVRFTARHAQLPADHPFEVARRTRLPYKWAGEARIAPAEAASRSVTRSTPSSLSLPCDDQPGGTRPSRLSSQPRPFNLEGRFSDAAAGTWTGPSRTGPGQRTDAPSLGDASSRPGGAAGSGTAPQAGPGTAAVIPTAPPAPDGDEHCAHQQSQTLPPPESAHLGGHSGDPSGDAARIARQGPPTAASSVPPDRITPIVTTSHPGDAPGHPSGAPAGAEPPGAHLGTAPTPAGLPPHVLAYIAGLSAHEGSVYLAEYAAHQARALVPPPAGAQAAPVVQPAPPPPRLPQSSGPAPTGGALPLLHLDAAQPGMGQPHPAGDPAAAPHATHSALPAQPPGLMPPARSAPTGGHVLGHEAFSQPPALVLPARPAPSGGYSQGQEAVSHTGHSHSHATAAGPPPPPPPGPHGPARFSSHYQAAAPPHPGGEPAPGLGWAGHHPSHGGGYLPHGAGGGGGGYPPPGPGGGGGGYPDPGGGGGGYPPPGPDGGGGGYPGPGGGGGGYPSPGGGGGGYPGPGGGGGGYPPPGPPDWDGDGGHHPPGPPFSGGGRHYGGRGPPYGGDGGGGGDPGGYASAGMGRPASGRRGLKADKPSLDDDDYGADLCDKMRGLENYLATQLHDRSDHTVAIMLQFVRNCFKLNSGYAFEEHLPSIRSDVLAGTGLPSEHTIIPAQLAGRVAQQIVWGVKARVFSLQPELEASVVLHMKMGQNSLGCNSVNAAERPSSFLRRMAHLLADPRVRQHVTVTQVLRAIEANLRPPLGEHFARHKDQHEVYWRAPTPWEPMLAMLRSTTSAFLDNIWDRVGRPSGATPPSREPRPPSRESRLPGDAPHGRERPPRAPRSAAAAPLQVAASAAAPAPEDEDGDQDQIDPAFVAAVASDPALMSAITAAAAAASALRRERLGAALAKTRAAGAATPAPAADGTPPPPRLRGCFNCGQPGHFARECPLPPRPPADQPPRPAATARANVTVMGEGPVEVSDSGESWDDGPTAAVAVVSDPLIPECSTSDPVAGATREEWNGGVLPVGFAPGAANRPAPAAASDAPASRPAPVMGDPWVLPTGGEAIATLPGEVLMHLITTDPAALQRLLRAAAIHIPIRTFILEGASDLLRLALPPEGFLPPADPAASRKGGEHGREEGKPAPEQPLRRSTRRVSFNAAATAGEPIDPGEAMAAATASESQDATQREAQLRAHAAGPGRALFFFLQTIPSSGVCFDVGSGAGLKRVFPLLVLKDLGANCNLMSKAYAESEDLHITPMPHKRTVHTSVGTTSPTAGMVMADILFAAGTEQERVLAKQLFLVVDAPPGNPLYHVLLGTRSTTLSAARSHVDARDWQFHYDAATGARAQLPMMVTPDGAPSAKAKAAASALADYPVLPSEDDMLALQAAADFEAQVGDSALVAAASGEEEEQWCDCADELWSDCPDCTPGARLDLLARQTLEGMLAAGDLVAAATALADGAQPRPTHEPPAATPPAAEENGACEEEEQWHDCNPSPAPGVPAAWFGGDAARGHKGPAPAPRESALPSFARAGANLGALLILIHLALWPALLGDAVTALKWAAAAGGCWAGGGVLIALVMPMLALPAAGIMCAGAGLSVLLGRFTRLLLRRPWAWGCALGRTMGVGLSHFLTISPLPPSREQQTRAHVRYRRNVARTYRACWGRPRSCKHKRDFCSAPRPRPDLDNRAQPWWRRVGVPLCVRATCLLVSAAAITALAQSAPRLSQGNTAAAGVLGATQSCWANTTVLSYLPDGVHIPPPGTSYTRDEECGWLYGNHCAFTPELQAQLQRTLHANKACFAFELSDLTGYTGPVGPFRIQLAHNNPIREPPRRMAPIEREVTRKALDEWVAAGFAEVCRVNGMNSSNMTVAAKKDENGEWTATRVCHDYRALNRATLQEEHWLPRCEDVFQWLQGKRIYTHLDLRSGFYQCPIAEEDRPKTAFWCDRVLYQFKRMPFGLKCAPAYFQRCVDACLAEAGCTDCAAAFIDDIIIASDTPEEHIQHVEKVLHALSAHGLKVHPRKSVFGAECVEYLGHNISHYGLTPSEAKVAAITKMSAPTCVSELRSVMGLLNYYRCYCPNFSAIASPLSALTKKNASWVWTAEHEEALSTLKSEICAPGKALKSLDYSKPIYVHTDWSTKGIGAIIGQREDDGKEYMCACVSRSLNESERRYESSKGEMLSVVYAVKCFRPMLLGVPFTLVTDHSALCWLLTQPNLTGQYARWAMILQEHDITVVHRAGLKHQNADALSRLPLPSSHDSTGARLDHDDSHKWAAAASVHGGGVARGLAVTAGNAQAADTPYIHSVAAAATLGMAQAANSSFIDRYAPTTFNVFQGYTGSLFDHGESEPWADEPAAARERERMQGKAAGWIKSAVAQGPLPCGADQHPIELAAAAPDAAGVHPTIRIDTFVSPTFFAHAEEEGVALFEPFGGMCAGLEMVLRAGITVNRYYYSDTSAAARAVAEHRVAQLAARYPGRLSLSVREHMFALPHDVWQITSADLVKAGARQGAQWLVVAGWECQDLSAAGSGAGLEGNRSSTFYALVRLVGALQQLQPGKPPGYLLENTYMEHARGEVKTKSYPIIKQTIGTPVLLDAARCGSRAHRLRCYWTNLADAVQLDQVFERAVRRSPGLFVDDILDKGRVSAPVTRDEGSIPGSRWYVCNKTGPDGTAGKRCALPTLVATVGSYSFRPHKPGSIYRADDPKQLAEPPEPNPDERERALGYATGSTAAPGISALQRHRITGGCMDANALSHLFFGSASLSRFNRSAGARPDEEAVAAAAVAAAPRPGEPQGAQPQEVGGASHAAATAAPGCCGLQGTHPQEWGGVAGFTPASFEQAEPQLAAHYTVALAAAAGDKEALGLDSREIWEDERALQYIRTRVMPADASDAERRRLQRCAKRYSWQSGHLHRRMADNTTRLVPPPDARGALVRQTHEQLGHMGEKRTAAMLMSRYWWSSVYQDATGLVKECEACARARVAFNQSQPELSPLPVKGLFYRWGVDLAGPFPETPRGHLFAMVCIEHWSKVVKVVPIKDKEADTVAYAFLHNVLAAFGAPAEVLTDQGNEWGGQFQQLLTDVFVDHRTTSSSHPASNGLAERAVQTLKRALSKYCYASESAKDWDWHCAWLALGYNCSPQQSTRLAPYQVLFGRLPSIPSAVQEAMAEPICFDDPMAVAQEVLERGAAMKRACAAIDENLLIAQHRDTQRYAYVRSGMYVVNPKPLVAGDYVWVKRHKTNSTLQMDTMPPILRVQTVWPEGMLTLIGKCGRTIKAHVSHCARCSLPNIDPTINPSLRPYDRQLACEMCCSPQEEEVLLLCDGCGSGWHNHCLPKPLSEVPPEHDVWVCPLCVRDGVTEQEAAARRASPGPEARLPDSMIFPDARSKEYQKKCAEMEGRVVAKTYPHPVTQKPHVYWGTVHYRGIEARPEYFEVRYTDGDDETMTLAQLRKVLQPEGTQIPRHARHEPSVAHLPRPPERRSPRNTAAIAALSARSTPEELLTLNMPGDWPVAQREQACQAATAYLRMQAPGPEACPAVAQAVEPLVASVALASCLSVLDPFGEQEAVAAGLATAGVQASVGVRNATHRHNALSPSFYERLGRDAPIEAIVSAPWPALLDIALPLFTRYATRMVCCLVPVEYISNAHSPRRAWLARLKKEDRLLFVHLRQPLSGRDGKPRSYVWLVIFASAAIRKSSMCLYGTGSLIL